MYCGTRSIFPCATQVSQTFYITIRPVDDSLPLLKVPGMRVQEGVRKTITEFELKATDLDTEVRPASKAEIYLYWSSLQLHLKKNNK